MKNFFKTLLLLCAVVFVFTSTASAELKLGFTGKCVGITDGDTIKVMHDGKEERIRLYGVDCPEKKQDFGTKAKIFTSDMVFGQDVDVFVASTDRYGRTIGIIYLHDKSKIQYSLNEKLIANGFAWAYMQYCKDKNICDHLYALQQIAQASKIGLWSMSNPIEPWNFRKIKKQ